MLLPNLSSCCGAWELLKPSVPPSTPGMISVMYPQWLSRARKVLECNDADNNLILQLPTLWFPCVLTTIGSGNSWEHHTGILEKPLSYRCTNQIPRSHEAHGGVLEDNPPVFHYLHKKIPTTVNNSGFSLKYHLCLRFEWIGSRNLFYSGITSKDRPWLMITPPVPSTNSHWTLVLPCLIVIWQNSRNYVLLACPCCILYLLKSPMQSSHTATPWHLQRFGCRIPLDTKIHRCSSTFFKMVQHLHITYTHSPVCLNSSLDCL